MGMGQVVLGVICWCIVSRVTRGENVLDDDLFVRYRKEEGFNWKIKNEWGNWLELIRVWSFKSWFDRWTRKTRVFEELKF